MKHWVLLVAVVVSSVALDQATKVWAERRLSMPNPSPGALCVAPPGRTHPPYQRYPRADAVVVATGYLDFTYAENCGGAFSILVGMRPGVRRVFFLGVGVMAIFFVLYLYKSSRDGSAWVRWGLPFVLAGAIGNLADRFRLGYVIDFIHMHWRDAYHWPTYNVADIVIAVGVGCLVMDWIVGRKVAPAPTSPTPSG